MKIVVKKHTSAKASSRITRKARIRKKIFGTNERPRLCIFRSTNHMYAQIIDDTTGSVLAQTSTLVIDVKSLNGKDAAAKVGQEIAKVSISKNIKKVVFDRNGFIYHGRVKSLADGARSSGLEF